MILLAQVLSGRLNVHQQWQSVPDVLPVLASEVDANVFSNGNQMDRRVRRATNRGVACDGILEGLFGLTIRCPVANAQAPRSR
jgi:hypothetical protein